MFSFVNTLFLFVSLLLFGNNCIFHFTFSVVVFVKKVMFFVFNVPLFQAPVSYTHLDVYKRQALLRISFAFGLYMRKGIVILFMTESLCLQYNAGM